MTSSQKPDTDPAHDGSHWHLLLQASAALNQPAPLDQRLAAVLRCLVPELAASATILRTSVAPISTAPTDGAAAAPGASARGAVDLPLVKSGDASSLGTLRLHSPGDSDLPPHATAVALEIASRIAAAIELEELRATLHAATLSHDQLLATLSHELRTPLNVVVGWVDLLRRGLLAPDRQDRALEIIDRNARVQVRLMDDLLDASRLVSGRMRVDPRQVALHELVLDAVDSLRMQGGESNTTIDLSMKAQPTVQADPIRVAQILHNLLGNAIKFTPADGRIDVVVSSEDGSALVTISDTGVGIAKELLEVVFDRFIQGERRTERARGLGLGLFIARHLARLHDGDITASSDGPGKGARFVVRLPLAGPTQTA